MTLDKVVCFVVAETRLRDFVAGLTNEDPNITAPVYKQYRYVQYSGTAGPGATVSVTFPPSTEKFRYVIIQNQFTSDNAICLNEVKVFVSGEVCFFSHAKCGMVGFLQIRCVFVRK